MKPKSAGDVFAKVFLVAFFAYAGCVLWYDLSHPEIWDRNPLHDPRIYLPIEAIVFPPLLFLLWRQSKQVRLLTERRKKLKEGYATLKHLSGDALLQRLKELHAESEAIDRLG
ncbi:MAG TPA: hypothetical protein VEL76_05610 [Gemmataceae bacterium]|nr:hypothetical protein [Gemmataceae bacterium]